MTVMPSYSGEALRHLAMPLGGIGTGQLAIGGDGGLRQWQLLGRPNHTASIPDSLFLIRANRYQPPLDLTRILQSREALAMPRGMTPMVNDDHVPAWQADAVARLGGVERTVARALYPKCEIDFIDPDLPLSVSLSAWSPLTPLDEDDSSLPLAVFDFTLSNHDERIVSGCLAGALQNAVGWDGVTAIGGDACTLYGGNVNKLRPGPGVTSILMENVALADTDATNGSMMLAALGDLVVPFERWSSLDQLVSFIRGIGFSYERPWATTAEYLEQRLRGPAPAVPRGPSPAGRTWNGALAVPFRLEPGEVATVTMIIAWCFRNRVVDFDQFGPVREYGSTVFWLGNAYAERFRDAEAVVDHFVAHRSRLAAATDDWVASLRTSTLPSPTAEAMAAQLATVRSPTCFRTTDGRFFGFEGGLGASTTHWSGEWGGSCPLNCNHVWNYEQTLSRLFPRLEQSMRATELEITQAPDGYIAHRVTLPVYAPQPLGMPSLGPVDPALDGMLGCPLKVYRELRQGADRAWGAALWPRVTRLMEYIIGHWDADVDGVLRGEQPNTFDIAFRGANTFIGTLWLAALGAVERLAELHHDDAWVERAGALQRTASEAYDALLWNGEYYEQELVGAEHEYGRGCLTDQLIGQWWAHQLDLGHVLPREHVHTATESIFRFNFRSSFAGFEHRQRRFAEGEEAGLLVCTWPRGSRPTSPLEYCDETWTGSEYAWAALAVMEGLNDEALEVLRALRGRYDGTRRNPFNEIECGDHYARSLSGWSVIEALSGWRYNALDDQIGLVLRNGAGELRSPALAGTGWCDLTVVHDGAGWIVTLRCRSGQVDCARLLLDGPAVRLDLVMVDGKELRGAELRIGADGRARVELSTSIGLQPGHTLELQLTEQPPQGGSS